jgi:hypothetical protein
METIHILYIEDIRNSRNRHPIDKYKRELSGVGVMNDEEEGNFLKYFHLYCWVPNSRRK